MYHCDALIFKWIDGKWGEVQITCGANNVRPPSSDGELQGVLFLIGPTQNCVLPQKVLSEEDG